MKAAIMMAMICSTMASSSVGYACAVGELAVHNCMKGARGFTPWQKVGFEYGFKLWKFRCPDAVISYNYESAITHDLNYRHGDWWHQLNPEEAILDAQLRADMLSLEVGTHPGCTPQAIRAEPPEEESPDGAHDPS